MFWAGSSLRASHWDSSADLVQLQTGRAADHKLFVGAAVSTSGEKAPEYSASAEEK